MKIVKKIANDIKEMRVQGAVNIAMAAVRALENLIKKSRAKNKKTFLRELESAGKILIHTRPSAIALPNAVNEYVRRVRKLRGKNIETLKKQALEIGVKIVDESHWAVRKIAKNGARLARNNSTVLIHCHSSTVVEILKEAKRQGKKFTVICTETRPWHQGFISAKQLADFGIRTELIVDSAAMQEMPRVDLVLTGADTITRDKKLVNKIGTSQIALIAKNFRVPMYCAAQKLKFTKKSSGQIELEERNADEILEGKKLPRVKVRNIVFDITPLKDLSGVITENGVRYRRKE